MEEVEGKITAPVFSANLKGATIPVIIEIKGRRFDDPLYTKLGSSSRTSSRWEEVIAIAGVGIYWW